MLLLPGEVGPRCRDDAVVTGHASPRAGEDSLTTRDSAQWVAQVGAGLLKRRIASTVSGSSSLTFGSFINSERMLTGQNFLIWFATSAAASSGARWAKFAAIWFDMRTRSPRIAESPPLRGADRS